MTAMPDTPMDDDAAWQFYNDPANRVPVGPPVTRTGKVLTDADVEALADEAERGYDVDKLKPKPKPERVGPTFDKVDGWVAFDDRKYGDVVVTDDPREAAQWAARPERFGEPFALYRKVEG